MLPAPRNWPDRIHGLLSAYEWSQGRLAMRLKCHPQTVYRWIHGRTVPIGVYREMIEELERRKGLLQDADEQA